MCAFIECPLLPLAISSDDADVFDPISDDPQPEHEMCEDGEHEHVGKRLEVTPRMPCKRDVVEVGRAVSFASGIDDIDENISEAEPLSDFSRTLSNLRDSVSGGIVFPTRE